MFPREVAVEPVFGGRMRIASSWCLLQLGLEGVQFEWLPVNTGRGFLPLRLLDLTARDALMATREERASSESSAL